jgi:methylthioribose-1-phosphate isomerase
VRTIWWEEGKVVLINQRVLPEQLEYVECTVPERVAQAIETMEIRGAPAIGVAAAMGVALEAQNSTASTDTELLEALAATATRLKATRPTARNLFWAVDRVVNRAKTAVGTMEDTRTAAIHEAITIAEKDVQANKAMGHHGAALLEDGDVVGTICNAGRLATAGEYGTALGVIKTAHEQGKAISVIALETRPVLQGARLTAFELQQDGIPVRVIVDGAAGYAFSRGLLDKFICGADRVVVSSGGHVINKVGTHTASVLADHYDVPFYVAAPLSTFDLESKLDDVVIEERAPEEITVIGGRRFVPEGVVVLNPAFDVTPPELVDAIITEEGVFHPPLRDAARFAT